MGNIKFDFSNKTAVVTGAAQGIGFEIVKQFLSSGAKVALWDYSAEGLDQAQKELADYSDQITAAVVDVTDRASCETAVAALPWKVDVLVNNAGITRDKSFGKMTDDDFDAVISTNLTGLYNVTKKMLGKFTGSDNRIINMSSVVALYGNFGQKIYCE